MPPTTLSLASILPESLLLTPTFLQKLKYMANSPHSHQEILFNAALSKEWNGKEDIYRVLLGIGASENGTVPVKVLHRESPSSMSFDSENERDPWVENAFKFCDYSKRVDFGRFLPVLMQICLDDEYEDTQHLHLSGELILPSVCYKLYDLLENNERRAPFAIAPSTLSHFLMRQSNRVTSQVASGYLSVQQQQQQQQQQSNVRQKLSQKQLVTLYKEDDPAVPQTHLDGIWVSGLDLPLHKHKEYLWAALTRYRHSRIMRRDHSRFLVVVLPQNTPAEPRFYMCQSYLPDGEESGDSDNYSVYPCSANVPLTVDDLGSSVLMNFEIMQHDEDLSADVAVGGIVGGANVVEDDYGVAPRGLAADYSPLQQQYQQPHFAQGFAAPPSVDYSGSHHSTSPRSQSSSTQSSPHDTPQLQQVLAHQQHQSTLLSELLTHIHELRSELTHVKQQLSEQCEQNSRVNAQLSHLSELLQRERSSAVQVRSMAVETEEHTPIKQRSSIGGTVETGSTASLIQRNISPHASTFSPSVHQQQDPAHQYHHAHHPQQHIPYQALPQAAYAQYPPHHYNAYQQTVPPQYPPSFYGQPSPNIYSPQEPSYDPQQRFYANQQQQMLHQQRHPSTPQSQLSMQQMSSYSHDSYDATLHAQQQTISPSHTMHVHHDEPEPHHQITSPSKHNSSYHVTDSFEPLQSPQKPRYAVMKSPPKADKKSSTVQQEGSSQMDKENVEPSSKQSTGDAIARKNPLLTPKNQKSRRLHDATEENEYDSMASIQIPSLIVSEKSPTSPKNGRSKTEQYMSRPPLSAKKGANSLKSSGHLSPTTPSVRKSRSGRGTQLAASSSSGHGSPFLSNDDTMPRIDFNPDDDDDDESTVGEHTFTPMSSNYTMDLDDSNWLTPGAKNYLNRHKLNTFSPETSGVVSPGGDARRLKLDR